jgi:hypothetical protein
VLDLASHLSDCAPLPLLPMVDERPPHPDRKQEHPEQHPAEPEQRGCEESHSEPPFAGIVIAAARNLGSLCWVLAGGC